MLETIFINLPVADVARSAAFYEAIGFEKDGRLSSEHGAAMILAGGVTLTLTSRTFYGTLTPKAIVDPRTTSGVLIALALDSRDAVDAITAAAIAAGGREAHGAEDEGFMYSRGFEDPDGHGFGPVWMNPDAGDAAAVGGQA